MSTKNQNHPVNNTQTQSISNQYDVSNSNLQSNQQSQYNNNTNGPTNKKANEVLFRSEMSSKNQNIFVESLVTRKIDI